jgi:hypothetical protein
MEQAKAVSEQTVQVLASQQLKYSTKGLIAGLICIALGTILLAFGVLGDVSWTAKILGTESVLANAAPGTVLFIIGLLIIVVTRYVLNFKDIE